MVFERENRAGVPSITSVNHRKYLNILLDTLQLNNVEFGEGIVLREALRTMRNSPVGYKPTVPFRETDGIPKPNNCCVKLRSDGRLNTTQSRRRFASVVARDLVWSL
jgi:hypothetical protein